MDTLYLEKSMKRAETGGTFKFFNTKFLGVQNDIFNIWS